MPIDRIIEKLEMLKAEIEWSYALDYQVALEEAIKLLEKIDGQSSGEN